MSAPASARAATAASASAAPAAPLFTLEGRIPPRRIPLAYRLGLGLTAPAMLLLPLVYLGIVGTAAYFIFNYARSAVAWLGDENFNIYYALLYFSPVLVGAILIIFLIKPLFARSARATVPATLDLDQQPQLQALIAAACAKVGAPMPVRVDVDCDINASAPASSASAATTSCSPSGSRSSPASTPASSRASSPTSSATSPRAPAWPSPTSSAPSTAGSPASSSNATPGTSNSPSSAAGSTSASPSSSGPPVPPSGSPASSCTASCTSATPSRVFSCARWNSTPTTTRRTSPAATPSPAPRASSIVATSRFYHDSLPAPLVAGLNATARSLTDFLPWLRAFPDWAAEQQIFEHSVEHERLLDAQRNYTLLGQQCEKLLGLANHAPKLVANLPWPLAPAHTPRTATEQLLRAIEHRPPAQHLAILLRLIADLYFHALGQLAAHGEELERILAESELA